MYSLQEWLLLDDQQIAEFVGQKVSTVALFINGTRRWFMSQNTDWTNYTTVTGIAQRRVSQLIYDHGVQTLIQPILGYDLVARGHKYLELAIEQGLAELATNEEYRTWYHREQIRVSLYGNWSAALTEHGFGRVVNLLHKLVAETRSYSRHRLLLGVFADDGLDNIVSLARTVNRGQELLSRYYGQSVEPVDLIISSGQPAIWDLPLLDINKASLYFLQSPTFCLNKDSLRRILYDHIYERINDDELYDSLLNEKWRESEVLGIGQRTGKGWTAT
ncbi:MAG: hypothetical protein AB1801_11945 [Chloroflexota bacterium]